jgi:peptidoglycan hydrolase-like protein with peptidoglycan-binding domain
VRGLLTLRGAALRVGRSDDASGKLIALRAPGSPDATLIGELDAHLRSTGRIDLVASWSDIADDVTAAEGFRRTASEATLEPITVDRMTGMIPAEGPGNREIAAIVSEQRLAFLPERSEGGGRRAPAAPIQRFGDTRHRRVTYRAISTSRFVSDFAPGLQFTRESDSVVVSVPSSAKPPAPQIVQVLPTFGWRRERSGTLTSSIRYGRGLRVYLDRPWYVSGEGELLGVVVWPAGAAPPGKDMRRDRLAGFVTEWGLDPVRRSGRLPLMPSLADFSGAERTMPAVTIPEAGIQADVAGYKVHHDGHLWYADIVLAAEEAYMPFVRLALVRLQPDAIPGAEVSAVSPAGFMQLTPDRSAVLIADPSLPRLYKLVVSGVGPQVSAAMPWRNSVEVAIEERQDEVQSDLGWQAVAGTAARITPIASATAAPAVLFSGLVEFAARPVPGKYRLAIREYETWQVDPLPKIRGIFERFEPAVLANAVQRAATLASPRLRAAGTPAPASAPASEQPFLITARAFERLGFALVGPPTGRRLVYAEFLRVDPPAPAFDLSRAVPGTDGETIAAPGDELADGDPEDPPRSWPSQPAAAPLDFSPQWGAMPPVGPFLGPTTVSAALKLAQSMLNTALALQPPLVVDGLFGPLTEAAIHALRAALMLPDDRGLDSQAWLALASVAPFPTLEAGRRNPPMTGPPIAFVQRLFNMASDAPVLPEDGVYSPATASAVRTFQGDRGLPQNGVVDLRTWLELAGLFELVHATGAEHVSLGFDRARAAGGGDALVLLGREPLDEVPLPASDRVDESWTGRTGLWVELQDSRATPLFRLRLGRALGAAPEVAPDPGAGEPLARPGTAADSTTLSFTLPVIPAARRLVVFGTVEPGDLGPATAIAVFEPW